MCYAKPGPRCSAHSKMRYERAGEKLKNVLEEVQPELDRINAEREGVEGAKRATEADLDPKLAKKLKNARGRHRDATRQFDATPAGAKYLKSALRESAIKTGRANKVCEDYLQRTYNSTDEKALKDQLRGDKEWTVMKQDRTSARSELTRVKNRSEYAAQYREHDKKEYKYEYARKKSFAVLQDAATRGDESAFNKQLYAHYSDPQRDWTDSAELQRRREPTISFPPATAPDAAGKRQVVANHSVNFSQGGKAHIDTVSYVVKIRDNDYRVVSTTAIETIPEKEGADRMSRKGFGGARAADNRIRHERFDSGMRFTSQGDAETALSSQRKFFAYQAASNAMKVTARKEDRATIGILKKKCQRNQEANLRAQKREQSPALL